MQIKVTDLFKDSGHNFDYISRYDDQQKLIKRMEEFEFLNGFKENFHIYCDEVGIVSLNTLEYFMKDLTKICSQHNITIV